MPTGGDPEPDPDPDPDPEPYLPGDVQLLLLANVTAATAALSEEELLMAFGRKEERLARTLWKEGGVVDEGGLGPGAPPPLSSGDVDAEDDSFAVSPPRVWPGGDAGDSA